MSIRALIYVRTASGSYTITTQRPSTTCALLPVTSSAAPRHSFILMPSSQVDLAAAAAAITTTTTSNTAARCHSCFNLTLKSHLGSGMWSLFAELTANTACRRAFYYS